MPAEVEGDADRKDHHQQHGHADRLLAPHFPLELAGACWFWSAPGATPSSASGSLGSFISAFCSAAVGGAASRLDRLITVPRRISKKAKASPVSPMRIRWAVVPVLCGTVDEAMAGIDDMQAAPLTESASPAKGRRMTRPALALLIAGTALVSACNKGHTITSDDDNNANAAAPKNVELPPMIQAAKSYRCGDNSTVYVDWMSDKKSANIRTSQAGSPNHVSADAEGQPMSGNGYTLEGAFAGSSVKVTLPGKGTQTCEA